MLTLSHANGSPQAMAHAAEKLEPTLTLAYGATVAVVDDALELRESGGALMIRYVDGTVEVHACGAISLSAPNVRIDASKRLDITAPQGVVAMGTATIAARHIATSAATMATTVERYQLTADRLVERARDAFRDVTGLLEARLGRARTVVRGDHSLSTGRTTMTSKEETAIDGKRILLG